MSIANDIYNLFFGTKRAIGGIIPDVVIDERHTDSLTITDSPVEFGAPVSDHAYMNPKELTMKVGWSPSSNIINSILNLSILKGISSLKELYERLLIMQEKRQPFSISTGKRLYKNMLIQSIECVTDQDTENALVLVIKFREVFIVHTSEVDLVDEDQQNPEKKPLPQQRVESDSQSRQKTPVFYMT